MARLLVVEDEAVIVMMLELWVSDLGHELVGPAANIATALSLVETSDIDAAIIDVTLGSNQSYEIADALRQKGVPFAWGTGYSGRDIKADYRDVPIISKPYDLEDFSKVVSTLLSGRVAELEP